METIRYTQIYRQDLALGTGQGEVTLADGRVVTMDRIDLVAIEAASTGIYVPTVGGTVDVITLTPTLAITSYTVGQTFRFLSSGANTGAVTVNASGLGAKAVTKNGTTALAANDIPSGSMVQISYDGTRFLIASIYAAQVDRHGADIASPGAGTLNLDAATGDLIDVTGTNAITAITLTDGVEKTVRFTGSLPLTYGASLILPGEVNIDTVAGDIAVFRGYAAGVVRCISYVPIAWAPTIEPVSHNSFRLSLTTALPVTTADVTAASNLYAVPTEGNVILVYVAGRGWVRRKSAQFTMALTLTSGKPYDVFVYDNSGVPALETLVWTNDTTRATALDWDSGFRIKTGDATRRYVGSLYASGANTTEDSIAKRYLWNCYHRKARPMRVIEATASWTYAVTTIRQARATATNQLDMMIGVSEDIVSADMLSSFTNGNGSQGAQVGIGLDSTTAFSASSLNSGQISSTLGLMHAATASYRAYVGEGRHYLTWLEAVSAAGTATFYGSGPGGNLSNVTNSGIIGEVWG